MADRRGRCLRSPSVFGTVPRPVQGLSKPTDFNTWTLCVSQTIEEKEEEKEEEDSFTEKETPEAKPRTAAETKPAQSRKKNWTDRKKK